VALEDARPDGAVGVRIGGERLALRPSFGEAHNLLNLLAAIAAADAIGVRHEGPLEVRFSALRGERRTLPGGVLLIDDCYNANPMSMRAAIDELAETDASRRVAVLGDMLELGEDAPRFHREIGAHAAERGVGLLVTVGPLAERMREGFDGEAHSVPDAEAAAELLRGLLRAGDAVLVKGSRGVGLELVARALAPELEAAPGRR
jgi:UDP-N-acetylmuramoyl-tripeptide--D-alanyl-D-alanine ligase